MNYSVLFIMFLGFVGLFGCQKQTETITVTGKIWNPNTNQAVSQADVFLSNKPVSSSVYNASYQQLAFTASTSDGSYTLKFDREKSSDYRMRVQKDGYFLYEKEYAPGTFESSEDVSLSFDLLSKGYVNTRIRNLSSYNQDDHVVFRFLNIDQQCSDCCPGGFVHGYGQYFDTSFVCAAPGDDYLVYQYSVTINNATNIFGPDSVFVNTADTTDLSIDY
ncbi:MAG: hypothetical protein R6T91_01195 [Bacteroidales bacterium]